MRIRWACVAVALVATATMAAEPKRLLFFGNSFTFGHGSTRSVDALVKDIAASAGHEPPLVHSAAVSGRDIAWHVANNTAAISAGVQPGREWDAVVIQEHSTKLTRAYDGAPPFPASVEQSTADVVALVEAVRAHSPRVAPVLYETWARGPGHEFYAGPSKRFDDPAEMQAEVRLGYERLKAALDAAEGADAAAIAPVGQAWRRAGYDGLHADDNWHAANRGTLLAALTIYAVVYGDRSTSDIDLSAVLTSLGLTQADGERLAAAADAALAAASERTDAAGVPRLE